MGKTQPKTGMIVFIKFLLIQRIHSGMNNSRRKGLSMIEITLSIGILAMIMLPVFMTFSSGNRNIQLTEAEFRAHTAALEMMEQIVSLPFKHIPLGIFPAKTIINGGSFGAGPVTFRITTVEDIFPEIQVEAVKRDNKTVFKKITVKIKFPATKNSERHREFVLKTIIANENI